MKYCKEWEIFLLTRSYLLILNIISFSLRFSPQSWKSCLILSILFYTIIEPFPYLYMLLIKKCFKENFFMICGNSSTVCMCAQWCLILCDPMGCSPPGSSLQVFSRQGHWSRLPFPSPGTLPNPRIKVSCISWILYC